MKLKTNWLNLQLQDIGSIVAGGTPSTKNLNNFGGTVAWITPADLTGYTDKYISKGKRNLSKTGLKNSSAILLPKGSVLCSSRAPIGYVVIAENEIATNQGFKNIVPNTKIVNSEYLYYFLKGNKDLITSFASGTTFLEVSAKRFSAIPIPVPPMAEQRRIVKKIEELFGVIDEQVKRLEATHAALVSYRQSVLADCLRKAAGVSTTLGKTVKPRRERVTFNGTNGNMIFIGMDCIESNALKPHKTDLLRNTKSTCFIFHKDDVLYGRMRSYLNKVFKAETNGAASAEFIVFPPTKDILPDYLKYLLHQQDFVSFATRNASGDRPRVKFEEDLAPFPFTLPSLPEQKAIVKKIENAFAFADKAQAAIIGALEQAKQLKQSILKRAFEGKLVPQDPNDKPVDLTQIKKDKHK